MINKISTEQFEETPNKSNLDEESSFMANEIFRKNKYPT